MAKLFSFGRCLNKFHLFLLQLKDFFFSWLVTLWMPSLTSTTLFSTSVENSNPGVILLPQKVSFLTTLSRLGRCIPYFLIVLLFSFFTFFFPWFAFIVFPKNKISTFSSNSYFPETIALAVSSQFLFSNSHPLHPLPLSLPLPLLLFPSFPFPSLSIAVLCSLLFPPFFPFPFLPLTFLLKFVWLYRPLPPPFILHIQRCAPFEFFFRKKNR